LKAKEGLPRMFVDFALVQLSMIIALAVCVFYHAAVGQSAQASLVIQIVRRYYFDYFWALSLVSPLVYQQNGFYTGFRSYTSRYKALHKVIDCNVGIGANKEGMMHFKVDL